ncbi:MAG: hypothetical protein KR126chlam1_01473 [Chlamydiae bacterium]|nr:hypothetical protein [Chlamydiota bacterium]
MNIKIFRSFKGSFKDFINYAKNHKILVQPENRVDGIIYTLSGWGLIALGSVAFQNSINEIPNQANFLIQFLSGTVFLFLIGLFKGIKFFKIEDLSSHIRKTRGDVPHLSSHERIGLIISRSVIAILGYELYALSRVYTTSVDNSSLFGADALAYAILISCFIKEKFTKIQWLGILITSIGIAAIFFLESITIGPLNALPGLLEGFTASFALAAIVLVNSVLIQHDPPLRVAFYQCLIGFIIFLIINIFFAPSNFHIFINILNNPVLLSEFIYSAITGLLYGVALLYFFRAFLFAEPLIIAALSYSLSIFFDFANFIINKEVPSLVNIGISIIITIGCGILIYYEYSSDRKRIKHNSNGAYYVPNLFEKMLSVKEFFKNKSIEWTEYMSEMHEYNKLLFGFSDRLENTPIDKIEIGRKKITFTIEKPEIKIITDGACRSAPFEILNFGYYEKEESIIYKLIKNGDCILDIGAHIGWFSLNFALRFPKSQIYSFEPILDTFLVLEENIRLNNIKNAHLFNHGFSETERISEYFYFRGGSALASEKNLLDYRNTDKKKVILKVIDQVLPSIGVNSIDFLKCDVEGSELFVLRGARQSISHFLPIIYIELYEPWCRKFHYSANDVNLFLIELGYSCFSLRNGNFVHVDTISEEDEGYNYFFLHKGKHKSIISKYETH